MNDAAKTFEAQANTSIPSGYRLDISGLFKKHELTWVKISAFIRVKSLIRESKTGNFSMLLEWKDFDGCLRERAFSFSLLHDQSGTLLKTLSNLGLQVSPRKSQDLREFLNGSAELCEFRALATEQLGWIDSKDALGRLLYINSQTLIGTPPENLPEIIFKPRGNIIIPSVEANGSLASWRTQVAEPCGDHPTLIFSLCVAFAAPLLKHINIDNFGVNLYGLSSRGKTTAAQVAASVYGCGADPADTPQKSTIQRWNSTGNAFEAIGDAHNDSLLILDELHTCSTKDFASIIYNLFGGRGKQRLTREADAVEPRSWRCIVLSTGEISAKAKVESTGHASLAGQRNRLLDLNISDLGIFRTGTISQSNLARQLKKAASENFGIAGPTFIKAITEKFKSESSLESVLEFRLNQLIDNQEQRDLLPEQQRSFTRFAVIELAGILAAELSVLPFTKENIHEGVRQMRQNWLCDEANLPDQVRGAIALQGFLLQNQSRFIETDSFSKILPREIAGYITGSKVMFSRNAFLEAISGLNEQLILSFLRGTGFLECEPKRFYKKVTISEYGRPRLAVIKKTFFDCDPISLHFARDKGLN
jgi:putative DNA primase/helicase